MCPLSWPLFEKATSQCGHLNFFGRCLRAVIIFTWASSANTRAYSCSITNGSTPINGRFGSIKSWYDGAGVGCGKNGVVGKNPGICCSDGNWFAFNLAGEALFANIVWPSMVSVADLMPLSWLIEWFNEANFSLLSSQHSILFSINFEHSGGIAICCDCIVVDVIVLSCWVFPSHGRNRREYVWGGERAHLTDIFILIMVYSI